MNVAVKMVGGGAVTLEAFAERNGLTMEVNERACVRGPARYWAKFCGVDVARGGMLIGVYGNGSTPELAIADYAPQIAGQRIKVGHPHATPFYLDCPNEWLPSKPRRPSIYDELVADVIEGLKPLRTIYGLDISEEAMRDRANNIVQGLVCNFQIEPAPEGRS